MSTFYEVEMDLAELDINIEDMVDLALEQGEDLYTRDELDEKIKEEIAEFKEEHICFTNEQLVSHDEWIHRKGEEDMEKYCLAGDHKSLFTQEEFDKVLEVPTASNLEIRIMLELQEMGLSIAAMIRGDK